MESRETIAAIATGMGNAGIGIVRISGDAAITVADRVFKGKSNKKIIGIKEPHGSLWTYI